MSNQKSFLSKRWVLLNTDSQKPVLTRILENRGIRGDEEVFEFLNGEFGDLCSPWELEDMNKTVERIKSAIEKQERIIVYGDYDVDGVTGTAIVFLILQELGANVSYRLPHRQDGYGLSKRTIEDLAEVEVKLLITVDCGISCLDEIALANEKGIDVVISDHHTVPNEVPKAYAILHPKLEGSRYPDKDLTGAGVALKLAQALIDKLMTGNVAEKQECFAKFSDLATLGTVADLGPLRGENRLIVKEGLKRMRKSSWEGLRHLLEICGIDEDAEIHTNYIGFRIAPRINAAGRLDSAYYALKLFLTSGNTALRFAEKLETLNKERQRLTEIVLTEADEIIKPQLETEKVLIAYNPNWHSGLVGIIAGKLSSKYNRPVIIMEERNDTYVGSSRGPAYYNLVDALNNLSHYLLSFGGHVQAAGFTLPKKNLPLFVEAMQAQAREHLKDSEQGVTIDIDTKITAEDLNCSLIDELSQLRPYGMLNERPIFLLEGVTLHNLKRVGSDRNHLLGLVRVNQEDFKFIAFGFGERAAEIPNFTRVNLVCHLEKNQYRNQNTVELQMLDFEFLDGAVI